MISDLIDAFINRWQAADGKEIANTQPFLTEFCDLLDVERPRPASRNPSENSYAFERTVTFHKPSAACRTWARSAAGNAVPLTRPF